MNQTALTDFGTRYAAAWSSQNPVSLASFYNEKGSSFALVLVSRTRFVVLVSPPDPRHS